MQKVLVTLALVVSLVGAVAGQVVLPTSYQLVFTPTGSGVVEPVPLPASAYTCGVVATAPAPAGTRVWSNWDDPTNATLQCRYYDSGTGAYTQKANRRWNVTLTACVVVDGTIECGPPSNAITNFIYRLLPAAPTRFATPTPSQAMLGGTIGGIYPDDPAQPPGARVVVFNGPFGAFQMMAGGANLPGEVNLPGYAVHPLDRFEITVTRP